MASKVYGSKYLNTIIAVLFIILDYVVIVASEQSAFLLRNFILNSTSLHLSWLNFWVTFPLIFILFINIVQLYNRRMPFYGMPDEEFLKRQYKAIMGKELNLDNPRTFNEKLQWLKLYNRKPEYTTMVDKYAVKKYVAEKIGWEYIIPTLGVWDKFEDIDFGVLPNKFVLKTTHDSGGVIVCKNKERINIKEIKQKIEKSLKRNFYFTGREWPYKGVKPRIIAEDYLENKDNGPLIEYKIFCFNGEPKYVLVCKGEAHGGSRTNDLYDLEFNHMPLVLTYQNTKEFDQKPKQFEDILLYSGIISKNIPQLRVDWYIVNNKPYFGEATFFHDCGYCIFKPSKWDEELGNLIDLSGVK